MERRLLVLMAETPVHAGGSESLGAVDLPIQREAATGLPVIWGQSLKGALRQAWRDATVELPDEVEVFGSKPPGGDEDVATLAQQGDRSLKRGSVAVGDAQLLLFPVAALRECFAWLTSPLLLSRLARKAALVGADPGTRLDLRPAHGQATGTGDWVGTQVLGPFVAQVADGGTKTAEFGATMAGLAPEFEFTRTKLATDVMTVSDGALSAATKAATDIVARVQLEAAQKTVKHGPFYSEHLPVETMLVAVLAGADAAHLEALADLLDGRPIQLGGDETIGKGLLWCRVLDQDRLDTALSATSTARQAPTPATTTAASAARPPSGGLPTPATMAPRRP